jgi:hypothetical protein
MSVRRQFCLPCLQVADMTNPDIHRLLVHCVLDWGVVDCLDFSENAREFALPQSKNSSSLNIRRHAVEVEHCATRSLDAEIRSTHHDRRYLDAGEGFSLVVAASDVPNQEGFPPGSDHFSRIETPASIDVLGL